MVNLERLELLKQFTQDEPGNPFNWYALAIEYRESNPSRAMELFQLVLDQHPSYLATYLPAAHLFAEHDRLQLAQETFEKGIDLAKKEDNRKAHQELQNAFQNFLFENDLD